MSRTKRINPSNRFWIPHSVSEGDTCTGLPQPPTPARCDCQGIRVAEYDGLILYLVNTNVPQNSSGPVRLEDPGDEPGPRLSEDIWRHLWVRVLKAEQRDELVPRSASPNPLGFVLSAKSSPNPNGFNHLRITAPNGNENTTTPYPLTPSSSTTTTTSASDLQHHIHPSTSSISQSEAETPDSSVHDSRRADSLDLPGLNSTGIRHDRRKAPWYDPWVRSRKMNQVIGGESSEQEGDCRRCIRGAQAPLGLKLAERLLTASPISLRSLTSKDKGEAEGGYQQLSDSTDDTGSDYGGGEEDEDEDEEDEEEDATARPISTDLSLPGESPLPGSSGSAHLAYLTNTSEENIESSSLADEQPVVADAEHEDEDLMMDEISRVKSPAESEKREGLY
ncbi:hypothetical protein IMY05_C4890000300 [Salix suchowensis]|nr:hypothetical protein IMY05_C4890000300 [Salix suchowensis]